jgi:hypothetical protein
VINKEMVKATTMADNPVCIFCNKKIEQETFFILVEGAMANPIVATNFKDAKLQKMILFHSSCWKKIAGEDYIFSDE